MSIVILAAGLLFALAGAAFGALAGLSVWSCLGLACLAGNLAVLAFVLAVLLRAARDATGAGCHATPGRSLLVER